MAEKIKKASPYFLILVLVGLVIAFNFWSSLDKDLWKKHIEAQETVGSSVSVGNSTPEIKEPFCVYGTGMADITLTENTGIDLLATVTIEDANGCLDIQNGNIEAWFYTSDEALEYGVTSCDYDENNCYDNTVVSCSFESCNGNQATYQCVASSAWQYFADATDETDDQASKTEEEWVIMVVASDSAGAEVASYSFTGASNSANVDLLTAMDLEHGGGSDSIPYGTLAVGQTSNDGGNGIVLVGIRNTGNRGFDPIIEETTSMTYTSYSINTARQKYHTATFTVLTEGTSLSADNLITALDLTLPQRGSGDDEYTSISDDQLYWGIDIPIDQEKGDYAGVTTYTPVVD